MEDRDKLLLVLSLSVILCLIISLTTLYENYKTIQEMENLKTIINNNLEHQENFNKSITEYCNKQGYINDNQNKLIQALFESLGVSYD